LQFLISQTIPSPSKREPEESLDNVAVAAAWWRHPRIIPRFDEMPWLLEFARTKPGRLVIVAVFSGLLALSGLEFWKQTGIVLALISLFPAQRRFLMTVAALWWVHLRIPFDDVQLRESLKAHGAGHWFACWPAVVALCYLMAGIYGWAARRFRNSPVGRHPVAGLVAILCLLLLAATLLPLTGIAFFAVAASAMILSKFIWFFAYSVTDTSSRGGTPLWKQIGLFRPFWGFPTANVPFGKGASYLRRVEATNDVQLAKTQLKGLKLLLWALVLQVCQTALKHQMIGVEPLSFHGLAFHGWIPRYPDALTSNAQGYPVAWSMRWLSIIMQFVGVIAFVSVSGHKIIATCRMAGFAAARNTYKPFTSTTIAEFYNRIYYYFKELLVDFFFYPTYLRYFKRWPKLRLFIATLAAAGLGNFINHFLANDSMILQVGFWQELKNFHTYVFYCAVLGIAIGISQHRSTTRRKQQLSGFRKVRAIAVVLTFYTFLTIFDTTPILQSRNLADCCSYFLSLFRP
jgi:hypothetical protein